MTDPMPWNSSFVSWTVCDDSAKEPTVSADLFKIIFYQFQIYGLLIGRGVLFYNYVHAETMKIKKWLIIHLSTVSANCLEIDAKLSVALPLWVTRSSFSFCFRRFLTPSWLSMSLVNKDSLPLRSSSPIHLCLERYYFFYIFKKIWTLETLKLWEIYF